MKAHRASVCTLDCPDTCSLTVTVDDDRIVEVRGSRANPYTAGVICTKVARSYPEFVHGSGRLRTPLRRVGAKGEGRFEPISWEEALVRHPRRASPSIMAAHGPQAIVPLNYAGPHGMLAGGSMDLRFFHRLGASLLDRKPLCGGRADRGLGGDLRPHAGDAPRAGRPRTAHRRVGQQRHLVELAPDARSSAARAGRAPSWWWSIRAARRSPARPICTWPSGPGRTWCWPGRWPPSWSAAARSTAPSSSATWQASRSTWRRHARVSVPEAARVCGVPEDADPPARRLVPGHLAGRHQRGQRPRAQPERGQRHPRGLRAAGPGRQVRRRWAAVSSTAPRSPFPRRRAGCSAPISSPRARAPSTSSTSAAT